ncbi:hypothetical protein X474_13560 [Dethiosulfatarculus sandiegensis]|uniref:Uncharacterized protein n=1 Tax=Dethiosulfatarculus sandiegensis TaxID=1429043 RepID=A0A0D2GF43_9BACT|nr:hypothetical protein X474_13560 [Dethiosulfatarculus sandiegensis]
MVFKIGCTTQRSPGPLDIICENKSARLWPNRIINYI